MKEEDFCVDFSDPRQKQQFLNYISTLKGTHLFKTKKYSQKVTVPMHRYYRGCVLKMLCDFTGHTYEEMHTIVKERYLAYASTKNLTTIEAMDFFAWIRADVYITLGLEIPLPNQTVLDEDDD